MLNKFTSFFVREIVFILMKLNINIKVLHIEGFKNNVADRLSRNLLQEAKKLCPSLEALPVPVPVHLMPQN